MGGPRPGRLYHRPVLCPSGKWLYPTRDDALKALARWSHPNLQLRGHHPSRPVRVYRCPDCRGWHLTARS